MGKSNQGSALASVLVITGASLVTLTMFLSLVLELRNESVLTRRKLVLARVQENITDLIKNDTSWQAIINAPVNASFNCLKTPTAGCPAGGSDLPGYIPFQLIQADGQPAYAAPNRGPGFTEQGEACQGANPNPGAGSDSCPFAILARWKRDCGPLTPCQNAYADVRIQFVYNPRTPQAGIAINANGFSIQTIRSAFTGNILARGQVNVPMMGINSGYQTAKLRTESAYYAEITRSFNIYLPPAINSGTLHINVAGFASVNAGAEGVNLNNAGIVHFSVLSHLCVVLNNPTSVCFSNGSSPFVSVDSGIMLYYTPANRQVPVTATAVIVRSIAGQSTPYTIQILFRAEALVPQVNPVRPQLQRIFSEYTVYR